MKKYLLVVASAFLFATTFGVAAEDKTESGYTDVYEVIADHIKKFEALSVEEMTIVVNLTQQEVEFHRGEPDGEKTIVCAFPGSTGHGKYAMIPAGGKTTIIETGPGSEGNRPSYQFGGIMRHCVRIGINNPDGSEAYVAFHSSNGEYVPRIPTTHGCIRIPDRAAKALFQKVWTGVPGKSKGEVKRKVPVIFVGVTPNLSW